MIKRIFIPQNIRGQIVKITEQSIIHRLKNVLRLKRGDKIILFNPYHQEEFLSTIEEINSSLVVFKVIQKNKNNTEPSIKINLFQSIIKKDKFEIVAEKTTEAGVFSITPLITDFTVKTNIDKARLQKIIIEATEQSGRITPPKINEKINFDTYLESIANKRKNIFRLLLHPKAETHLKSFINNILKEEEIDIIVGPEGGFSEREISLAKEHQIKLANFGPRILKSETIAPIIIAFILNY